MRLEELRVQKPFTQRELATAADVAEITIRSHSSVSPSLNAKPPARSPPKILVAEREVCTFTPSASGRRCASLLVDGLNEEEGVVIVGGTGTN